MMRYIIFSSILVLVGCFGSKNKFKTGQCINPVDGSQVYKLTAIDGEKMRGHLLQENKFTEEAIEVPKRMYVEVPCPN